MSNQNDANASERAYYIKSSLLTLLEKGFGLIFSLGLAMILWRHLTKAEMGSWSMFLILAAFVEMARSGMIQNALMRFIAQYRDQHTEAGHIQTSALVLSIGFSILSTFVLFLSMQMLASKLESPQLLIILPVYFLVNFTMIAMYHANYVQQAYFEFRGIFWSTFFYRGVPFAYAAFCSLRQIPITLHALVLTMLLGAIFGSLASMRYAWPFFHHARELSKDWLKKVASYGRFVLGTNVSTMVYKSVDKIAVSGILGPESLAVYDAAARITQMVEVPSFSIAAVVFPQSARAAEEKGAEGVKHLYERSVGAILAFILPFVLVCIVFAEPIVVLLAGEQYRESSGILRLTALFGLFLPYAVQFGTILDSTGKPNINFWYNTGVALLNLCLSYVFVRKFGLYGGAYATLITYIVSFFMMQRLLRKNYNTNPLNAIKHIPSFYGAVFQMVKGKIEGRG
jgi:lipopolysaccharide exporter